MVYNLLVRNILLGIGWIVDLILFGISIIYFILWVIKRDEKSIDRWSKYAIAFFVLFIILFFIGFATTKIPTQY